eukprot:m.1488797 g.1488797  ORF g.1488797 m.1488797 type:complete len:55 (-) comp25188_c1_seq10:692-856(-)
MVCSRCTTVSVEHVGDSGYNTACKSAEPVTLEVHFQQVVVGSACINSMLDGLAG